MTSSSVVPENPGTKWGSILSWTFYFATITFQRYALFYPADQWKPTEKIRLRQYFEVPKVLGRIQIQATVIVQVFHYFNTNASTYQSITLWKSNIVHIPIYMS